MTEGHEDHDIHGLVLLVARDGSVTDGEDCDCPRDCTECADEDVERSESR